MRTKAHPMLVLGIDTSCDDTSCAVVRNGRDILSSIVSSQTDLHRDFGGVVPELACRSHILNLLPVLDASLRGASVNLAQIDCIAVTHRPGLIGALLIGLTAAKAFACLLGKPLVGLDHIASHLYSVHMCNPPVPSEAEGEAGFPCVGLVVSGGHTQLYYCRDHIHRELLGGTQDDAAGEAYDKVAGILGLGYPGGSAIDATAKKGDRKAIRFKRAFLDKDSLDFSFSGIKTAVLYHVRGQNAGRYRRVRQPDRPPPRKTGSAADIAAGFQEAVVDVLVAKTVLAARKKRVGTVTVSGGVAANSRLREAMTKECRLRGLNVLFPLPAMCTDNAAMVAGLGYHYARAGKMASLAIDAAAKI